MPHQPLTTVDAVLELRGVPADEDWKMIPCTRCGELRAQEDYYVMSGQRLSYCKRCFYEKHHHPRQETGTKRCRRCGEIVPVERFPSGRTNRDGLDSWCNDCHSAQTLFVKTGATREWQAAQLVKQEGRCGGCGRQCDDWGDAKGLGWRGNGGRPVTDHKVVGGEKIPVKMLESHCNTAIGSAFHDWRQLFALAFYCMDHRKEG